MRLLCSDVYNVVDGELHGLSKSFLGFELHIHFYRKKLYIFLSYLISNVYR